VKHGRSKPYTDAGVRRLPCARCGNPASRQWQICADGNLWRPLCWDCDVALNKLVLEWMGDSNATDKMAAYRNAHKPTNKEEDKS